MDDDKEKNLNTKGKGKKNRKKKRHKEEQEDGHAEVKVNGVADDVFQNENEAITHNSAEEIVVDKAKVVESKSEYEQETLKEPELKDGKSDAIEEKSDDKSAANDVSDDVTSVNKPVGTPDSGISDSKGDSENSVQDDYKVKVETVKNKLRSSKSLIDNEAKGAQEKVVRTGFWDKLRFAMSQPIEDEQAVTECRRMFREEMVRLRREVEEFQDLCLKQIKIQKQYVDDHKRTCEKEINDLVPRNGISRRLSIVSEEGGDLKQGLREELQEMESSMEFFQQKQKLLDQEMELLNKEEELAKKHKDLEEYEKEIQEVESLLNQRQAICDRRQKHLLVLDEELHSLRQELEESKDQLQNEASSSGIETASNKAKKNWDIVRRNLMDKQHLLETTVQKYRSELASASSNIAGKEIMIGKLQQQLAETEAMVIASERKIKQLENKLAYSVTESRILEEQLHGVNRKNSLSLSPDDLGRRSSFFHRQTSSDQSGSRSKSPLHLMQNDHADESRLQNGSATARPSTLSPDGSTVIRRRSMRSNSVAGDTLSRMALREKEQDTSGSGACAVM